MPKVSERRKVRAPRRLVRRAGKRRTYMRKPRTKAGNITNKHYCQVTETITLDDINANQTTYETFSLKQFPRALSLAPNFKFYKAKKVLFKYEPIYNTFQGEGAETVPLAFMVMNRTQERFNYTPQQLQQQGAIPRKFTNTISLKYTPNWCSQGLGAYTQVPGGPITSINAQGLQKQYGYLACPMTANSLDTSVPLINNELTGINVNPMSLYTTQTIYNGHIVHIQQQVTGAAVEVCRRTVTVVWEFRGPKTYGIASGVNENEYLLPAVKPEDTKINNTLNSLANLTIQS